MKEFLSHHGIAYKEHIVDQDQTALNVLVEKTGRRATPVLLIGEEAVVGFDRGKISGLLGIGR
ncbi:MAG: glutaredoxin family protein [Nitrospinota bacterium]